MTNDAANIPIDRWVDEYGDRLYRHALARVRRVELAEDLVQETFLAAMRSADQFRGEGSALAWLLGILRHKILDAYRAAYREERAAGELPADDELDEMFDARGRWRRKPGPWTVEDDLVSRAEFWAAFRDCLDGLPVRLREVFTLRVLDDISGDEVCKALGVSATNLWVALHRARARLRGCLEVHWFDSETAEVP